MINWESLSKLTSPAIIIAASVYLIQFFGKIISDQKPFADDRRWEIESSGIMFFVKFVILNGVIGFAFASKWNIIDSTGYWINLIILLFLSIFPAMSALFLGEVNYKIQILSIKEIKGSHKFFDEWRRYIEISKEYIKKIPSWAFTLISIMSLYLFSSVILHKEILWISIYSVAVFFLYISLAANYSLKRFKPIAVDIYLNNEPKPVKNVLLLKINDDNIRYRKDEKVVILNKEKVEKIEISIDKNKIIK